MIHNHVVQIHSLESHIVPSCKCKKQHISRPLFANKSLVYLRTSAFHLRFMKHQLVNQTNEIIAGRTYIHACMLGEKKKGKTDMVSRKYHTQLKLTCQVIS